jgi:hypothetical protein
LLKTVRDRLQPAGSHTFAIAVIALCLSLATGVRAQQRDLPPPPPRYPVDGVATQNACTTQRLINDLACTFEIDQPVGSANPNQARENEKAAAVFAHACGTAATHPDDMQPDPMLMKSCEAGIAQASLTYCSFEGRFVLIDDDGHWALRGRECASRLQLALARTRTQATVSLGCCRCVADAKCAIAPLSCTKASQTGNFPPAARACVLQSCSDSCNVAPAPKPARDPEQLPVPPKPLRSSQPT